MEHPESLPFNFFPLFVSLLVSLGGLTLGWLVYRNLPAGAEDPLKKPLGAFYTVLRNKYYFDEVYQTIFVKPAYWLAETFTYLWLDRRLIDGFLHLVARISSQIGGILRNYFDKPIVNGFGDLIGEGTKKIGRKIRVIQTGHVQQYMLIALLLAFVTLSTFLYLYLAP